MRPWLKKITGGLLFVGMLTTSLSLAYAQGTFDDSILGDIKSRLQSEGIAVIDYSDPAESWGSLPDLWVQLLDFAGYTNLADVAQEFEVYFEGENGLVNLRGQVGSLEAQKSQVRTQAERDEIDSQVQDLQLEILANEESLRDDIRDFIMGLNPESVAPDGIEELAEEGSATLLEEIDYYFSYDQWGPVPSRIYGILEGETGYTSLQNIVDVLSLSDAGNREAGLTFLRDQLTGIPGLSLSDVDLVADAALLVSLNRGGEEQLNSVGQAIAGAIQNIAGALAILWIVIAGIRMIFADGDENTITEQKKAILYGVIGLVVILLVGRLVNVLYGAPGEIRTDLGSAQDAGFSVEVFGLVSFLRALIGTVAILMIVMNGARMLFAQGQEDQLTKLRTSVLWVGVGLILIAINEIIIKNIFILPAGQDDQITTSNIANIINTFGRVMQFILGFVGVIAFGILVYGGATMILNFGNDEMVERSKKIIRNAIIGILVILSAFAIVSSLLVFS